MSAGRRLVRTFAVTATLLMLLMVADSSVVKIAFAEPVVSPAAYANNNTTPPPPPPLPVPPPDEPQRPVEPGTVTQGWDNSSFAPTQIADHRDVVMQDSGNETSYETTYGNFVLNKSSPYFVHFVSPGPDPQEIAKSAFLVLYQGLTLLSPANGIMDNATSDELSFHYGLYLSGVLLGTMKVDYRFQRDTNNITISFSPSVGLPSQYAIAWLTFTSWDAIDTAYPSDVEQRFEDLTGLYGSLFLGLDVGTLYGTGTIEMPGAIIRPYKVAGSPGGPEIRMDISDAAGDFNASFGGSNVSFLGFSGNAVLSTLLPGRLTIDPSLVASGVQVQAAATAYSVQRKTFYDGQRYWLFWKSGTGTVSYSASVDGKSWNSSRTAVTAGAFNLGFTVINYGKTVGVLWTDNSDSKRIHIRTGLVTEDVIQWDDTGTTGRQLDYPCCSNAVQTPVSATFTSQASLQFGITWLDAGGSVGFERYKCVGTGFTPCSTISPISTPSWDGWPSPYLSSVVVAFNDGSGSIARILSTQGSNNAPTDFYVRIYYSSGSSSSLVYVGSILENGLGTSVWSSGLYAATAVGNNVVLAVRTGSSILEYTIDSAGGVSEFPVNLPTPSSPRDFTAGADGDGNVYLFYSAQNTAYYARSLSGGNLFTSSAVFPGYSTSTWYLSAASYASHFIPVAFTLAGPGGPNNECPSGYCLYYSGFPLPLDGEAAITNPWATKLGEPLVTDVGGVVSPTTGLLANGQILVAGKPALSLVYREPGLFNVDGTKYGPSADERYQIIPGIYYDLPWIAPQGTAGVLHMPGGQRYELALTGQSGGVSWYNISRGMRYTVLWDASGLPADDKWVLTMPSGAYMLFDGISGDVNRGNLTKAYVDTTGQSYVTYTTTPGSGTSFTGTIMDSSTPSRTIRFSDTGITSYGNGQAIAFTKSYQTNGWSGIAGLADCTSTGVDGTNTGRLQVTDAIGRVTTYWVCKWKLVRLESPNGGRVDYFYADTPTTRISQGTEAYSYPLTLMNIYNESAANVKARSLTFNWNFQNGEVVRALVNTTDKSAVVQGSNEYIFNSAAGTASVRIYDSTGQILYYDMSTLCGSLPQPCASSFLQDLSGNQHPGSPSGTTTVGGKYGGARQFSSQSDWITTLDGWSTALTPSTITVSAWIKTSSTLNQWAVSKWLSGGSNSHYLLTAHYTSVTPNRPTFHISDGASSDYIPTLSATINDGNWHMLTGTFDGKTLAIYRDGVLDNSKVSTLTTIQTTATATELVLGQESSKLGIAVLQGVLDEVHIFKRALSPEEIGILYTKNALKKGEQQNWYSVNGQPHMVEGFVGDETSASVVTQDAIDGWGNQIYHRDALGNETFASYANTNHQNHFYAPGRLTKTGTSNTEFVDFSDGLFPTGQGTWTVTGLASPATQIDYTQFDKVSPSLKINAPSSGATQVVHPFVATGLRFVEFRARVSSQANPFEVIMGTSTLSYLGARFCPAPTPGCGTSGGVIQAYDQSIANWVGCTYPGGGGVPYLVDTWYRFTFNIDGDSPGRPWKLYLNGIDLSCGTLTSVGPLTHIYFTAWSGTWSAWVDDIKVYNNNNGQSGFGALNIGFSGLQPRQSIRLLAEDGSVIDQGQWQTGYSNIFLSFNAVPGGVIPDPQPSGAYKYAENGDNAKTVVQIYAEDGTLEYQSPLTRFFVGETYTYTRPRALADELVKTRSGALYWLAGNSGIYASEFGDCENHVNGINCYVENALSNNWLWRTASAAGAQTPAGVRGNYVHVTPFDYGVRTHDFRLTTSQAAPAYFVMYVRIPDGKRPDGIGLLIHDENDIPWGQVYWGAQPISSYYTYNTQTYMGPVPSITGQWIQLVVSKDEAGLIYAPGAYHNWNGIGYQIAGGEAEWDVTTTQTDASLMVSGLNAIATSGLTVGVYYASNGTTIATSPVSSGDSVTFSLYNRVKGIDAFPLRANIKIYKSTTDEYYFGPTRDIWPGDTFRYIGASSFFDSKSGGTPYWPSSSIHTALLGSKKFSGDCLSAILCYDMETMTETQTTVDTGAVTIQMLDLSGKGSHGTLGGVPIVTNADIGKAAAGLGTTFNVATSDETAFTMPTIDVVSGHWNTVSFWMYWTGTSGQIPFGFSGYNLYFASTYFGFNTANNGDIWGIDNTSLANTRVYVTAEFYNGDGKISKLYINGVQKTLTQKLGTTVSRTASTNAKLASWPGDGTHHFGGTIDQAQIFNRALTDTEILEQYYSGMPGGPQVYVRPLSNGLANATRTPYEGTYLYATAQYDNKGNVLSVTDVGRSVNGGKNVTRYAYSTLDGRDYRTQVNRSDGKQIYTAYDFQSGVKYGTLDIDCRRSRTQYDAIGRPIQTSVYDTDFSEVLHLDMETATYNSLKDVSCAGTGDSRNGQPITQSGTTGVVGIEGSARSFSGVTSDNIDVGTGVSITGTATISFWVKPSNINIGCCGVNAQVAAYFQTGSTSDFFVVGYYNSGGTNGIVLASAQATVAASKQSTIPLDLNWHHIVVTKTAGDISAIYIDGVDRTTTAQTYWVGGYSKEVVGASYGGGSLTAALYGALDEVRLFNVVRSTSEITNLWSFKYNLLTSSSAAYDDVFPTSVTTYDGVSTPRALFYDMSTCIVMPCAAGGKLEDLSGHGNDGTMTGTSNDPSGEMGSARSFNGTGDVITEASNNGFSKTTITVSVWVKVSAHKNWIDYVHTNWCAAGTWNLNSDSSGHAIFAVTSASCTWAGVTSTQTIPLNTWTHLVGTYDGTTIKVYVNAQTPATVSSPGLSIDTTSPVTLMNPDDAGSLDEVQVIPRALSSAEVSDLYLGVEKSHMSKTYQDGLGRTTRSVVMDMFGTKIKTVATLGWNDKPIYVYLPSGQYSAFTYDFLGRTLSAQSPGDSTISGISRTIVSEKARMVESIDAVGRKAYTKMDLLGRIIETGVWNPQTSAYGNRTNTSYNALSEVTVSKDAKGQTTTVYYNSLGKPKMTVFPDSTDADKRYSLVYYDDNLRAFEKVDVMGRVAVSTYDSIGRVTSVKLKPSISTDCTGFPNPCVVTYTYDPIHGDLLSIDNVTANVTRTYDSLHRMATETLKVPSSNPAAFTGTIIYTYDNASKVTGITYPISGNPYAYYIYDSLGRPKEVGYWASGSGQGQGVFSYDSFGRLDNIHYWKGAADTAIQEKYTYDARDRVTQVKVFNSGLTIYMQLDYTYNKASEITASTDNMLGTGKPVIYAYDGNGRLAYGSGPWGTSEATETHAYTYDQVGNLLTWKLGATTYNYNDGISYPVWNKLNTFSYNTMSFTYNAAGSMLTKVESGATTTYTQDFLQQLAKVVASSGTYTYSYDGIGRRVKTVDSNPAPAKTMYFMYAGSKMLYSKDATVGTETAYVYVGNKLLLKKEGTLDARYYHNDISPGNVRLITYYNAGIIVDAKYRYRPFGDMVTPPLAGSTQRFQYAQQEYDSASRQYHMGLRYQDPVVGRFAQRDPIGPGYSYASNNPISLADPTGMYALWEDIISWARSPQGGQIMNVVMVVATLASFIPTGGSSAILYMVIGGLIGGVIAIAVTYLVTGGHASANQYALAFSIGFAVGAVVGGVYGSFRVAGQAANAAAKASLSRAAGREAGSELEGLPSSAGRFRSLRYDDYGGSWRSRYWRLPTRPLSETESGYALSADDQLLQKFQNFFKRGADYQKAATKLGLDLHPTESLGEWREINRLVLENPEGVIGGTLPSTTGRVLARGYIATVEDVRLLVFVYDEGTVSGLYATTVLPSQEELLAAGLL